MGRRAVKRAVGAVLFAAALLWCGGVTAQQHPERRHLRAGNRSYEAQEYAAGAEAFREALAKEPSSFAAAFNLADALYKQGDYAGAAEVLGALAERSDLTPGQRAKVFHNLGNDMFAQQKLKEAADFYKQSLRENPADLETTVRMTGTTPTGTTAPTTGTTAEVPGMTPGRKGSPESRRLRAA